MANWFKLYETDLDETRLKYALSKLPEVGWVWIGILSECCKSRSDTIRWGDKEHELFGFADRLKVSIPKVNEAITLLREIDYISLEGGQITVTRWNEKQSDYHQRKARGDYQRVSDNIGDSPLEEKRGDKRRATTKLTKPQVELSKRLQNCLNGEWVNDAGKWVNRIKAQFENMQRVIAEVENAIKEGRVETTPARYAEQIWKEFTSGK